MNELMKNLSKDTDGMLTYEYIVNHIGECDDIMVELIENMKQVDRTGQFVASTARYLAAINKEHFHIYISMLIEAVIEKDREHKYIPSLLTGVWGNDYMDRVEELRESDDNFRRIFKRVFASGI